jgi:hypothetical protein
MPLAGDRDQSLRHLQSVEMAECMKAVGAAGMKRWVGLVVIADNLTSRAPGKAGAIQPVQVRPR